MVSTLTTLWCLGAASATLGMFTIAVRNYNPGSWETVVILGGWNVAVYAGLIGLAIAFRKSLRASAIMLLGAVVISGFSLFILYGYLSAYFIPPTPTHRVMSCVGPVVELGLPILQWPTLGIFAAIALIPRRSDASTSHTDGANIDGESGDARERENV